MKRVLCRHKEIPLVLNEAQLSIKIYHEVLEDDEDDEPEDSSDLRATSDGTNKTQVCQRPETKTQQIQMPVDPDVMEYITTRAFKAQLSHSLAAKKSKIIWKSQEKMAVIVYTGEDDTESWKSECMNEVQNYLGKFSKCDVQVKKEFWEAVVAKVPVISACLGFDPPLIKTIDDSHIARIVSLHKDVKSNEEQVKSKLEEIYNEEIRKSYLKKKFSNIPEECLVLLKKIKFVEKLQDKYKELEIKVDVVNEEIYFEGPQKQFHEATMKFRMKRADMVRKKLNLSASVLDILSSDEGLQTVNSELENSNLEAVFVVGEVAMIAWIVGTSAEHAYKAENHVDKLILEEKVQVDEKSKHLLISSKWLKLREEINAQKTVRVHGNSWNDTYVAGFREEVIKAIKKLNTFLENNCIREEHFVCTSDIVRRYLVEVRQEDLRSIEDQLKDFAVKIEKGKGDNDFDISGNKEGLKRVRRKIDALIDATETKTFDVKQPGLQKYFDSGKGDRLVRLVEKEHDCVIQVQKNVQKDDDKSATEDAASSSKDDDNDDNNNGEIGQITEQKLGFAERASRFVRSIRFKSTRGTTGSRPVPVSIEVLQGDLCKETTDAIVNITSKDMKMDSAGKLSQAVKEHGGQQVQNELKRLGKQSGGSAVITSGGRLPARHIIHLIPDSANKDHLQLCVEECLRLAETRSVSSISIPAVGTGAYRMSAEDSASLIFKALNNFKGSFNAVRKVRIVIFQSQMMQAFQKEHQKHLFSSKVGVTKYISLSRPLNVEVVNGDLTKEETEAIMNINSTDMDMNNAGELSKVIARESGPQVQQECSQLGKQSPGSAVITSGGTLKVPFIVHIIPGSSDMQHLQQCLEEGLRVADDHVLQSISIPCVGTGGFGLVAADSAQVTFQALNVFSRRCKNIRKVRVVVYDPFMMQEFLHEQQSQAIQDVEEQDSNSEDTVNTQPTRSERREAQNPGYKLLVSISIVGKDRSSLKEAQKFLEKGFSEALKTENINSDVIRQLSQEQIAVLKRKADDRDIRLIVVAFVNRIAVQGEPTEVSGMVGEIWKEINKRTKKNQEKEKAQLVSKYTEWTYEIHGTKKVLGPKANAKIEMAHSKKDHTVQVSLRGEQFVINLKTKTGRGKLSGEQITLTRKVKGAEEG